MTTKKQPLAEIAARIDAHLKRFEKDPVINASVVKGGRRPYYGAGAGVAGAYVSVTYISYQGSTTFDRDEAERYLAWLDAGNVGPHYKAVPDLGKARAERARQISIAREAARRAAEEERAAKVVFEPVTVEEAEGFVEGHRAGSDMWRLAKTLLMHLRRAS